MLLDLSFIQIGVLHLTRKILSSSSPIYNCGIMQEVLREAGYVASNSERYPLGGIITAIQNAYHVTPEIECSGDALEELRLCFYKDFKVRNLSILTTQLNQVCHSMKLNLFLIL